MLLVFPLVLALIGYYRAQLAGAPLPRPQGDTAFYAYQLKRAAECQGRWWQVAADHRLGHPYPSEFAKHPGLYEGVDLMLLAAPFAGAVSAAWAYHLTALVAILVNGWVAAWIVHRMTRSILWALVAVTLITLNESVAVRLIAHLHLFKFGWVILAVWAFAAFLSRPVWWRGLILGSTVALALPGFVLPGFLYRPRPGILVFDRARRRPRWSQCGYRNNGGGRFISGIVSLVVLSRLDKLLADRGVGSVFSPLLGRDLDLWGRSVEVFYSEEFVAGGTLF